MTNMHGRMIRVLVASGTLLMLIPTVGCATEKTAGVPAGLLPGMAAEARWPGQMPYDPTMVASESPTKGSENATPVVAAPTLSIAAAHSAAISTAVPVVESQNNEPKVVRPNVNVFGEVDGVRPVAIAPPAQSGMQQHTAIDEGYDTDATMDPTGQWLVFASTRHAVHTDLYLQRAGGTAVTQLTSDPADDAYPTFSPDGKQIAFCSTRGGNWDIYVMDNDGRNVVQVTNGAAQDLHPSFSPDGTRLAYCSLGVRSNQWELWTINLQTAQRQMIGFGLFPSWSPSRDGERIAFQRARQRGSRWFSIWTVDIVNGEARRPTEVAASTNAALTCPTWSPDGKQLAFTAIAEPNQSNSGKSQARQDIWVINADGTGRKRLTDGMAMNLMPYWAVDNRVYFVSDRGGPECIWSVQAPMPAAVTGLATHEPAEAVEKPEHAIGAVDTHEVSH